MCRQIRAKVIVFSVFILTLILVAGCNQSSLREEPIVVTATPTPKEIFTLRVASLSGPPVSSVMDILIAGFGARYPNVDVKLEFQTGDYAESMYAMAAAGNLPDVIFTADIFTAPFVDAELLLDMQPLAEVDEEFDLDDIYPNILSLGRLEGEPGLYMVPASLDTVQMYYNKTIWEESGAPLPESDWTWSDLIEACQIIQAENEDVHCLGYGSAGGEYNWWAIWVPWVRGYGGDVLSPDGTQSTLSTPESLAGLQAFADLWVEHEIALPLGSDLGGDCFVNQRCAAFFHIPGLINNYRDAVGDTFEWDVQLTPAHPKGHFTGMGTFGFAITANTDHPQAAWDFVKYLASKTGQRIITSNYIGMPLLKSMADDPIFEQLKPPPANLEAFIQGGDIGIFPRTYPVECGSLYSGQVDSAITAALETIIRGESTAADVFPAVDAEIQTCLDGVE